MFSVIDYVMFASVLLISLVIGIFASFQQKSVDEYAHGRRNLSLFSVSLSMAVSITSTVSLLGLPAEVYLYGIEICFILFSSAFAFLVSFTLVPVLYEINIDSVFEYCELRFQSKILKNVCTLLDSLRTIIHSAIVIFGISQALESLMGIPAEYNLFIITSICVIYTSVGGLRGVIWTDVFQTGIMVIGIIIIISVGIANQNKYSFITELYKRNRVNLHYFPNPFQRTTVWTFLFDIFSTICTCSSQSMMLRYTSLKTLTQAKLSVIIGSLGLQIFRSCSICIGVIIFTHYSGLGCGPLASKDINSANQILPFYIKHELNYYGMPGILAAMLLAGALSTVSSNLNSVSITLNQLLPETYFQNLSFCDTTFVLKVLVLFCGCITTGVGYLAMYSGGTLFQIALVSAGIINGPITSMFVIGGSLPFVGIRSISAGCICSFACAIWISTGSFLYGNLWEKPNLISESCLNDTIIVKQSNMSYHEDHDLMSYEDKSQTLLQLYSLSPFAFAFMSFIITFSVACVSSFIPGFRQNKRVKPNLIFPFLRSYNRFEKYLISENDANVQMLGEIKS